MTLLDQLCFASGWGLAALVFYRGYRRHRQLRAQHDARVQAHLAPR